MYVLLLFLFFREYDYNCYERIEQYNIISRRIVRYAYFWQLAARISLQKEPLEFFATAFPVTS